MSSLRASLGVGVLASAITAGVMLVGRGGVLPGPMPTPAPVVVPADGKAAPTIGPHRATRFELVDASGGLLVVIGVDDKGRAVLTVNDGGRAINLDLVRLARLAR